MQSSTNTQQTIKFHRFEAPFFRIAVSSQTKTKQNCSKSFMRRRYGTETRTTIMMMMKEFLNLNYPVCVCVRTNAEINIKCVLHSCGCFKGKMCRLLIGFQYLKASGVMEENIFLLLTHIFSRVLNFFSLLHDDDDNGDR